MNDTSDGKADPAGSWMSTILLAVVHLIAIGMLYLVVVQMNWAFQDFFNLVGAKPTPRFEAISTVSAYIATYTPFVLLAIGLHIYVICRLSRRANRWTAAYSHAWLLAIGFTGFLWTAWAVETIAWGAPGAAIFNVLAAGQQADAVAQLTS